MRCNESDEVCGKHSGIPHCCREFFKTWIRLISTKYDRLTEIRGYGYVPCPGCRHCNSIVKLKGCPK